MPTCFKNPEHPSCVDLVFTNPSNRFQSTCVNEAGSTDFHKMAVAVVKASFKKLNPKYLIYRKKKSFSNQRYREDLVLELAKENFNTNTLDKFLGICVNVVNQHATCKKKTLRGNNSSFMNKKLSKAIMTRTKLRNKFQKNRTEGN